MNVTFSMSFQDYAEHSGQVCTCHSTKHYVSISSPPQAHFKNCPIADLYVEWQQASLELWERVKDVPVKVSSKVQLGA